ncbi:MAG: hypothetical protein ACN4GM_02080 [Gammaproteobacteria bacterium]
MFNKIILLMFFLGMISSYAIAAEQREKGLILLEEAFEAEKLQIRMTNDLKGTIVGRICDQCKNMTVTITPQTKAFERNKPVSLIEAKKRYGKRALVIFDIKTKKVNEIRWR